MTKKTLILAAAAACAAAASLTATTASADPWWGWRGGPPAYEGSAPVDGLFAREHRIADRIRWLGREGRLNPWETRRAWQGLWEAQHWTQAEAREHGRFLPAGDYYRISSRLDGLDRFIAHEANDWD